MSEDDINNILTGYTKTNTYQSSISRMINKFMINTIAPWLSSCFNKYSEEYFHGKMSEGFNFVEDWKKNHPKRYNDFMSMARKPLIKRFVKVDEFEILRRVETILEKKNWVLTEQEKRQILANIVQFKQEIGI